MKKEIRLLIEGLFNDEIFNRDEYDQDVEVAQTMLTYKIGDIIYKNEKSYAICAGLSNDFSDNNYRFVLLDKLHSPLIEKKINKSSFLYTDNFNKKWESLFNNIAQKLDSNPNLNEDNYDENDPDQKIYFGFKLWNKTLFLKIDEDGYENTQLIKNKYNLKLFPAIEYCSNLGDNVYLPAIDELQIMMLNLLTLNKKSPSDIFNNILTLGSSSYIASRVFYLSFNSVYCKIYSSWSDLDNIQILPFVKI